MKSEILHQVTTSCDLIWFRSAVAIVDNSQADADFVDGIIVYSRIRNEIGKPVQVRRCSIVKFYGEIILKGHRDE